LFCAFTLREVRCADGDRSGVPFTCMHMFTINTNIFGGDFLSWYTLNSGDQRSSGHLGIMEWSGPIFSDFEMNQEDLMKLPFKAVWFGHTKCKHDFLKGVVKAEYLDREFLFFANFEPDEELKRALQEVRT
jgi:hypothetical protein